MTSVRTIQQSIHHVFGIARSKLGTPVPLAKVTVTDVVAGGQATVYSDEFLTTLVAQPLVCGADGRYDFYVGPGKYTVSFAGNDSFEAVEEIDVGGGLDAPRGTYASSHGAQFDADGAWLTGAVNLIDKAQAPPAFPFFKEDLTRYASNPVITPSMVGGGVLDAGNTAADPFLLGVGKVLYCFFELLDTAGTNKGQIYRCQSTDNGHTWTGFVKCSQDDTKHYHCPMAFVHLGEVHLFFEYADSPATLGALYHQSCSIASFETATPAWGAQTESLNSTTVGMPHRFTEGTIFQHQGLWYCFVVTGPATATEDRQLYGWWSPTFITDWNTYGQPMTNPVLDSSQSSWLINFTHPAAISVGSDTFLTFGIDPNTTGYKGIGVFAITDLSPDRGLTGVWLEKTFMWPLNSDNTAWDGVTIHRGHAVLLNGTWTFVYDGLLSSAWKIGIATMSARGAPRASNPTSPGEVIRPASYYDIGTRLGAVSAPRLSQPVGVKYTSVWGIDLTTGNPIPYYNAAGVTPGDEAIYSIDNVTGQPVLTRMVG